MSRSLLAAAETQARNLRYSYLFLPSLIALAFSGLAFALTAVDRAAGGEGLGATFPAGPDGARAVLTTIAASLITVAGVAFSITVVSLQLVSQQFTPRALRNFLGDRLNQVVAGVFIGVFLYCVLVLRRVEAGEEQFVPGLSLTVAVALAFVGLASLLVFIHHMAHSIQVSNISGGIAHRTLKSLERLYPESYGEPVDEDADALLERWHAEATPVLVYPDRPGFVQSVDDVPDTIGGTAFRVALFVAPGDFVTDGHPLAAVWTDRDADDCAKALRRALAVANERDLRQDTGYGVRQLADIAVKALSPSVNDPTTATTCIGYLQAVLERLARREWPGRVRRFAEQDVTIVMRRDEFADYLESLVQIGRYATQDARAVDALLHACLRIAEAAAAAGRSAWAAEAARAGERIAARALAAGSLDDEEAAGVEETRAELARAAGYRATRMSS